MKSVALVVLSFAVGFGQAKDCDSLERCQEILKTNPKSSLARFRIGEIFFAQGKFEKAAAEGFVESTRGDGDPEWTQVWSHVNLGRIYDITNQRARALNEYRIVLNMKDNSGGALDQVAEYIETPYKAK